MISVVIPTFRSGEKLKRTLSSLRPHAAALEIIVVDTEDCIDTVACQPSFPDVRWFAAPTGRGPQQNAGASAATGDILLFLHSDTRLQAGWIKAVEQAVARPGFTLGAFRFKLDQPGLIFRGIEAGVRLRNRLFQLPYGDQALFTSREIFTALGGFPDQSLMEDVELVWKARKRGRVRILPLEAISSADRWRNDGVWRRTWINWRTYLRYKYLRSKPDVLVHAYESHPERLIIFAKRPEPGKVKTRLAASIGETRAVEVYRQLVEHTLVEARASRAPIEVHFAPADAASDMRTWLGGDLAYTAQPDGDLGSRLLAAFSSDEPRVVIGTDCPGLCTRLINQAFDHLKDVDLVLGPSDDGGYYLMGAKGPHPELFREIPWSTEAVCSLTRKRAEALNLSISELTSLSDVDVEADLAQL
jgi:rSAM/selenodomain-associated transferase 2/rSAM/selenodomain-associated transferase 1